MTGSIALWIALVIGQAESPPVDRVLADARARFDAGKIDDGIATLEVGAKEAEARGESDLAADRWLAIGERERTRDRSRFAAALAAFEHALALSQAAHPIDRGDDARVAAGLCGTGDCLRRVGRFAESLERTEAALAMRQRLFPNDHPDVAASLDAVANCKDALGRGEDALPQHEAALAMRRRLTSGDDPDVAATLDDLAQCLLGLGRTADAMPKLEETLAMRRRLHPGDHADVAQSLNQLADGLRTLNRSTEAQPRIEEALAMDRRLFPADHPDVARSLCNLALCRMSLGRLTEALPNAEEALAMRRRLFPADHPDVALSLNVVASGLHYLGRFDEAIRACDEELAIRRRSYPDPHPMVAGNLESLSVFLAEAGRVPDALAKHEEALAMWRRLYPGDHLRVANSITNNAGFLRVLGRNAEALAMGEEALAMYRRLHRDDDPSTADCLSAVAACLSALGRPAEALPKHEAALAIRNRIYPSDLGDHPSVALSLHNIADCLNTLGRPAEALPREAEALAMWRRIYPGDHPNVVVALEQLGGCLGRLGRESEAVASFEEAIAMERRLDSGDHWELAHLLTCAAITLSNLGRRDEALATAEEALAIQRRLHSGDDPDVALSLSVVAMQLEDLDREEEALATFEEAVAMGRRLHPTGHPDLLSGLLHIATIRMEDPEQENAAAALLAEAIEIVERARRNERTLDPAQRAARFLVLRSSDPYPPARRLEIARGAPAAAFALAERANGRFFLDLLEGAGSDALEEAERDVRQRGDVARAAAIVALRESIDDTDAEDARLTREVVRIASDRGLEEAERERRRRALDPAFAALGAEKERCATERARVIADILPAVSPATPDDVRGALRPGELLLEFALDNRASDLFVVDPNTVDAFAIPALRDDVARVVADARAPRSSPATGSGDPIASSARGRAISALADDGAATGLFAALIPEAAWKRIRAATRVFVVTDGALHRIPLETLTVAPGRTWLDAGPPIAYVPSASVLVWLRERSARQEAAPGARGATTLDVLALGDPDFAGDDTRLSIPEPASALARSSGIERFGGLPPLPGTHAEALAVAAAFGAKSRERVSVLLGADATESKLFELAPKARYVHLATHGLFDEVDGQSLSALALSFPAVATAEDDGFLKLDELIHRWRGRLDGCRMVVLSACETQVGVEQRDNAPFALSFGFLFAGASSVVSSLWAVNDASTAELMADFYARLAKAGPGADRLAEFTAAKRAMKERGASVAQWAPFVYVGIPD